MLRISHQPSTVKLSTEETRLQPPQSNPLAHPLKQANNTHFTPISSRSPDSVKNTILFTFLCGISCISIIKDLTAQFIHVLTAQSAQGALAPRRSEDMAALYIGNFYGHSFLSSGSAQLYKTSARGEICGPSSGGVEVPGHPLNKRANSTKPLRVYACWR